MRNRFILAVISAFLLVLAYPKFNLEFLAWIALVPLFFAIQNQNAIRRFTIGYIFGTFFFYTILRWLGNVTIPGTIFLVSLVSLCPAIFCLLYNIRRPLYAILFVPSAWVFTEYLRTHFCTGFPWALLGYSQSFNVPIIQIADITGVFGVSFLVVLLNFGIYLMLKKEPKRFYILFFIFILFVSVLAYAHRKSSRIYLTQRLKVAVIQGNIPQEVKWDPHYRKFILDKYKTLTKRSLDEKPRLVIWPETSVPGYLDEEGDLKKEITDLAGSGKVYLLVGTLREKGTKVFNSATLISDEGKIIENYDKIHLVPFGEFIPFGKLLFRMRDFIDKPIGDFDRGRDYKVFNFRVTDVMHQPDNIRKTTEFHHFSALICFEDIFPGLCRIFVKNGAKFLVNITNDAWFEKSAAPYQHLQCSIFRAVENRVPVVRAANTGVSCIISQKGKITEIVRTDGNETFVDGYVTGYIQPGFRKTFYTRFGDVFCFICIGLVLVGIVKDRKAIFE